MILPAPLNIVVYLVYLPTLMLKMINCSAMKEIMGAIKGEEKDEWVCGFCHVENNTRDKYKVFERWISELRSRECMDDADIPVLRQTNAELCKYCFKLKKRAGKMKVALEKLSYLLFLITVLPVLFILMSFLPSLLRSIADILRNQVVKRELREEEGPDDDGWSSEEDEEDARYKALHSGHDFDRSDRKLEQMANIRNIFKELGDV